MLRDNGKGIAWTDKEVSSEDHVPVPVTITGGAQIGSIGRFHAPHQIRGMHQVRIRVVAAEILQRRAAQHRAFWRPQTLLEDVTRVGARHPVHAVEQHAKSAGKQGPQSVEIEQFLHDSSVIGKRIHHCHPGVAHDRSPLVIEIHAGMVASQVMSDRQGVLVDLFRDSLGSGTSVADVVFDAEVRLQSSRVVTGCQQQPAQSVLSTDHRRHRRSGQDPPAPHQNAAETVRRGHAKNSLDSGTVVVPAISAHHQHLQGKINARAFAQRIKDRLDEVLEIVGLHEDTRLLS